jgi:hypothetical protein
VSVILKYICGSTADISECCLCLSLAGQSITKSNDTLIKILRRERDKSSRARGGTRSIKKALGRLGVWGCLGEWEEQRQQSLDKNKQNIWKPQRDGEAH